MYEPLPAPLQDYATADQELLAEIDGTTYHATTLVFKRKDGQYIGVYCRYADWAMTAAGKLAHKDGVIAFQQQLLNDLAERNERAERELEQLKRQLGIAASDRDLGQQALLDSVNRFSESNRQLLLERDGLRVANDELRRELSGLKVPFTPEVTTFGSGVYTSGPIEPLDLDEALDLTPDPADDLPEPEHTPLRLLANDPHATIPCRYGCGVLFVANSGRGAHEKKVHGAVWQGDPLPVATGPWRCLDCRSDAFAESVSQPGRCIRCAAQSQGLAA